MTTSAMVRPSVNSTSATEARMVVVRSSRMSDVDGRRNARGELRKLRLDLIDRVDDVGAGLLEHGEDDAVLVVLIGGDVAVDLVGHRLADVAHADRRAVAIGQDHVVERLGVGDLIVGRRSVKLGLGGVERALGALVVELTSVARMSSSVSPLLASLAGSIWMRIDGRAVAEDR